MSIFLILIFFFPNGKKGIKTKKYRLNYNILELVLSYKINDNLAITCLFSPKEAVSSGRLVLVNGHQPNHLLNSDVPFQYSFQL